MTARVWAGLVSVCLGLLLETGAAAGQPAAEAPLAAARALAVRIVAPDRELAAFAAAEAPPGASTVPAAFAYPADGSVLTVETASAAASADLVSGVGSAAAEAGRVSLFAGEIAADRVRGSIIASAATGDPADSAIANLVVLGAPVTVTPNLRIPLADWGYAVVLEQSSQAGSPEAPSFQGAVTGLVVHLDADHGGLLAGSEIRIGFVEVSARPPQPEPSTPREPPATTAALPESQPPVAKRPAVRATPKPRFPVAPLPLLPRPARPRLPGATLPPSLLLSPPAVTPELTEGGYVFPVYGPSAYGDSFGSPRADVSGGWHHGDDIFAPLGAPVLAVTDGTVFSVGWNDIGGYRLWLRDSGGNEFYYAHLSAYTTLAVDGARVRAGDVLGFVGNSGDAAGTPYHLHFEVHPVALLFLGYDGAVNPTAYLDAWRRLEDVTIRPAVGFAPPVAPTSEAPTPGAILLQSSDISTASGLEPGALRRALIAPGVLDLAGTRVGSLPVPLPVLDRG